MEAGIVGLPNVGKSTLFNALTQSKAAQSPATMRFRRGKRCAWGGVPKGISAKTAPPARPIASWSAVDTTSLYD